MLFAPQGPARRQRGTVLLIAIVLLLLASVISLFAVNVGSFEQAASGNDVRAKLVQQVADSALAQGAEHVLANTSMLQTGFGTVWTRCAADDTSFPCGAIPAARRNSMFRYNAPAAADIFGGGLDDLERRMLVLENRVQQVNNSRNADGTVNADGFAVAYGVGVVLCRLVPQPAGTANPQCSTDTAEDSRVFAVTLVSVADMGGEGSRATAVKSFATQSTFGLSGDQPPILASGSIDLTGTLQIVTNPNSGGVGVPISVWTRKDIDKSGTPNSCYADEFFRLGAKNNSSPFLYPVGASRDDQTLVCDDCSCPGDASLSFTDSGGSCGEGIDMLDVDNDACGENRDVRPQDFPCDIFEHIFGVKAWEDTNADFFCEKRIDVEDPEDNTLKIGTDEDYLSEKANHIIVANTPFDARFAGDSRVIACDAIENVSGLVWDRTGDCGDNKTIGTPANPVLLVSDGAVAFQNLKLFGLLFVRSSGTIGLAPCAGAERCLSPTTGGDASLRLNAGSVIYGSVVVQGVVDKANGTAAVIHDPKVLASLINNLSNPDLYGLPGSWSDSVRY